MQIADFGLSSYYSDDALLHTFCGSPLYASPEIVNGLPYHGPEVLNQITSSTNCPKKKKKKKKIQYANLKNPLCSNNTKFDIINEMNILFLQRNFTELTSEP